MFEILLILKSFLFFNIRKLVFPQSNLINYYYTFVCNFEAFIFFSLFDPSRVWKLSMNRYYYFFGNMAVFKNSVIICTLYKRAQLEIGFYYRSFDWDIIFERDLHRLGCYQKRLGVKMGFSSWMKPLGNTAWCLAYMIHESVSR